MSKEMTEGYKACEQGFALHDNPHCYPSSSRQDFVDWMMGFCRAKKEQANNGEV